MSATGLRAVNLGKGNSDPYVVLSLPRTGETKTTTICLNTCNPMWYHNVIFNGSFVRDSEFIYPQSELYFLFCDGCGKG